MTVENIISFEQRKESQKQTEVSAGFTECEVCASQIAGNTLGKTQEILDIPENKFWAQIIDFAAAVKKARWDEEAGRKNLQNQLAFLLAA